MGKIADVPDLLGTAEVAELLGISTTSLYYSRLSTFSASGKRPHRFPKPVAQLKCGPIWKRKQIERYIAHEERLRGLSIAERRLERMASRL